MDVNILLFPDFETLDAFGPVEVFGCAGAYRLRYVSMAGGTMISKQGVCVLTEEMRSIDPFGILLIPGGQGTRTLVHDADFIERLSKAVMQATHCLTVCTGSALLAKTGLLDGKRATSNKKAFGWVASVNEKVLWMGKARWVADQKYYTSSGVSAGIDMALAFVAEQLGMDKAREVAAHMEYIWNSDSDHDPFAT